MAQVPVHNFSNGLLNPGLGYLMTCLGSFLGLRCITRARAYTGRTRAIWLLLASLAIGATGIWVMHFIAMLGFAIPGQQILYNVPVTLVSLLAAVVVVAIGLFIVGYSRGGVLPVLAGGVIIGIGVSTMHYVGMSAMSMQGTVRYSLGLVGVSVLIAIVAGTAGLPAGRHRGGAGRAARRRRMVQPRRIAGDGCRRHRHALHRDGRDARVCGTRRDGDVREPRGQLPVPAAARGERPHVPAVADYRHVTQRGGDPRRRQPERTPGSGG